MRKVNMQKLTPKEAVRAFCMECLGMEQFNTEKVRNCEGDKKMNGGCLFFPYRLGKRPPVKVFRKFCVKDCMNGNRDLIATCMIENCPNYLYRMGKNPFRSGIGRRGGNPTIKSIRKCP